MHIVTLLSDHLYTSDAINDTDDWNDVAKLDPNLIVNMAGHTAEMPEVYLKRPMFITWHIDDVQKLPDVKRLKSIAKYVAKRIKKGDKVLVHDKAGMNRVNLMAGYILHELKCPDPVDFIEKRNTKAFTNKAFKDFIAGL